MARGNSRKQGVVPVRLGAAALVVVSLLMAYVWIQGRCDALGLDIRRLEGRKVALQRMRVNEELAWSHLMSPSVFERALQWHGLRMAWPQPHQIVRIPDRDETIDRLLAGMAQSVPVGGVARND